MAINIENNMKASSKLGKRDDLKLFNSKNNKEEVEKTHAGKKPEEATIGQFLTPKKYEPPSFYCKQV